MRENTDSSRWKLPEAPEGCPSELYDLMVQCWSREKEDRPAFNEICMFLRQKTAGYNPAEDIHLLSEEGEEEEEESDDDGENLF